MNPLITLVIPVVIGLVQVVKSAKVPSRYLPACAVVFGIVSIWIVPNLTPLEGLIAGLSAVGLFSGARATAN